MLPIPPGPPTSTCGVEALTSSAQDSMEAELETSKGKIWTRDPPNAFKSEALSGWRTPAMMRLPGLAKSCLAHCMEGEHTGAAMNTNAVGHPQPTCPCIQWLAPHLITPNIPPNRRHTSSPMPRLAPVKTMVLFAIDICLCQRKQRNYCRSNSTGYYSRI